MVRAPVLSRTAASEMAVNLVRCCSNNYDSRVSVVFLQRSAVAVVRV